MADPRLKTIKIKTGVVKRLTKEKVVYEKEAENQQQRVEKYKKEGKDEYEIRKQEEVLQESLMMVPDCQRRLLKAYDELHQILATELDLQDKEEFKTAQTILEEAALQLPKPGEVLHMC
ncbi:tubulin-specific chaperone a [Holotrichia oblita]|uniref:Tubulin-specific chaperone a n=1 Tax=Holotrichia oblita TaxID=644536 RepID=A0ACB9SZK3_HOLOL|nr:tubulin-specific chaperone a [Holotrichia oblita]